MDKKTQFNSYEQVVDILSSKEGLEVFVRPTSPNLPPEIMIMLDDDFNQIDSVCISQDTLLKLKENKMLGPDCLDSRRGRELYPYIGKLIL